MHGSTEQHQHITNKQKRAVQCANRVRSVRAHTLYRVSLWRGHIHTLLLQRNSYFIGQEQEVITK